MKNKKLSKIASKRPRENGRFISRERELELLELQRIKRNQIASSGRSKRAKEFASKRLRVRGRFVSKEAEKTIKEIAINTEYSPQEFINRNVNAIEGLLNETGFEYSGNFDTLPNLFKKYYNLDYSFVDSQTNKKINYQEIQEILIDFSGLRKINGVVQGILTYSILAGKKQIIIDLNELLYLIENSDNIKDVDFLEGFRKILIIISE